jgi:hypothetical protein
MHLLKEIFWATEMKDDRVIEARFDVPYCYEDTGWGIHEGTQSPAPGPFVIKLCTRVCLSARPKA